MEQSSQSLHVETTQSIAQGLVLQDSWADVTGQATPPCATGVVTLRIRVRKPLPQVCVQLLHACHAEVTQSTGHGFDLQASTS
jgi:hypothetical protein